MPVIIYAVLIFTLALLVGGGSAWLAKRSADRRDEAELDDLRRAGFERWLQQSHPAQFERYLDVLAQYGPIQRGRAEPHWTRSALQAGVPSAVLFEAERGRLPIFDPAPEPVGDRAKTR